MQHAGILDQMQRELENLRQQLKRYQDGIQVRLGQEPAQWGYLFTLLG